MSRPKEPDRVAALELSLPGLAFLRRVRGDVRAVGDIVSYLDETGRALAWTGDEEAPYIKIVPVIANVRNQIPNAAPAVPGLQAFVGPGRLLEAWALDLRDQSLSPPTIWFQLHDSAAAPAAGSVPVVTSLPLCCTAAYEWSDTAQLFQLGLFITLSSTALFYTPVAASQEFSLTARIA